MLNRLIWTGFGLGLSPLAPGTCGTLLGVLLAWQFPDLVPVFVLPLAVAALLLAPFAAKAENRPDPPSFVLDEVVGYLVALMWVPYSWQALLVAFVAFRVFDIGKPWPIKRLEKVPGGWGVLLDDVMAGIYAHAVVRVFLWIA